MPEVLVRERVRVQGHGVVRCASARGEPAGDAVGAVEEGSDGGEAGADYAYVLLDGCPDNVGELAGWEWGWLVSCSYWGAC